MSSLYDQYYSETNINHLFNILSELIIKETKYNLNNDLNNLNKFKKRMNIIFENSNNIILEDINKELLQDTLHYFLSENKEIEEEKEENIDFMSEYNNFINNRENPQQNMNQGNMNQGNMNQGNMNQGNMNQGNMNQGNMNPGNMNQGNMNQGNMNQGNMNQGNMNQENMNQGNMNPGNMNPGNMNQGNMNIVEKDIKSNDIKSNDKKSNDKKSNVKKKKFKKNIIVSSKDRINKDSNRFNYKISNSKEKISELDSLIIPIEDTIHFTSPVLVVKIEELDLNILLTCNNILEINNYKYGIYKAEKHIINKTSDILTISIESIYGKEEYNSDIVNIIYENNKIKLEDIEDFNLGDILILSNKNTIEFTKIKSIELNELELEDIINFEKGDELSILNSNLQNTLIFK